VGYRPFVFRTAHELGINGWVLNGAGRVRIQAEGSVESLDEFEAALVALAPPIARPWVESSRAVSCDGDHEFAIRASVNDSRSDVHLPPDLFTCDDCVEELRDPNGRRSDYPFINCTQCGPRYTIIEALPYDRPKTSMAGFDLCEACRGEFESPMDRRFHAQPLACPDCGPGLEFRSADQTVCNTSEALALAIQVLELGGILATKGVGGYHLICDAANDSAVRRLRERKQRPHKPLAVMFPMDGDEGLAAVRLAVCPNDQETAAIMDAARPIVLVGKQDSFPLSPELAPGLSELGVFLPYSPLHHILLSRFGGPVVATSGNISGEPVITDNAKSEQRLGPVADAFLHHNRPIVRPADDPVIRIIGGAPRVVRLGRGIAPVEIELAREIEKPTIALGGHMKNTVALAWGRRIIVSPHIGDLDSLRSLDVFEQVVLDLQDLYGVRAEQVVCDLHPGYASSRWAARQDLPVIQVQHHRAHAAGIAGENPEVESWLVFAWDGVGYGDDGTLWGGETFSGSPGSWQRTASFRPFQLVGGDLAGRQPWRSAAALIWQTGEAWVPRIKGASLVAQAWSNRTNSAQSSAVGRLFDAAASLVLGRDISSFEGQGPMELESLARPGTDPISLPMKVDDAGVLRCDWQPLLPMLRDNRRSAAIRASVFHESLAQALVDQAVALRDRHQVIGLTGGVFQNRFLCERVIEKLSRHDFDVRLSNRVPANDGGLCFGQVHEVLNKEDQK
jgi:hydrogenase maturation protein HypF